MTGAPFSNRVRYPLWEGEAPAEPDLSGQWSVVSGQWSVVSAQWSVLSGRKVPPREGEAPAEPTDAATGLAIGSLEVRPMSFCCLRVRCFSSDRRDAREFSEVQSVQFDDDCDRPCCCGLCLFDVHAQIAKKAAEDAVNQSFVFVPGMSSRHKAGNADDLGCSGCRAVWCRLTVGGGNCRIRFQEATNQWLVTFDGGSGHLRDLAHVVVESQADALIEEWQSFKCDCLLV